MLFVINRTSLFFHNRRFETPDTKKNIENEVQAWCQGLESPPPPKRLQASSNMGSTASKANSNSAAVPVRAFTSTTESDCCAVIVGSSTEVLKKQPTRGTKRRADELESHSEYVPTDDEATAPYGGLGEDEDDSLEQAAAVASPVKPSDAAKMS